MVPFVSCRRRGALTHWLGLMLLGGICMAWTQPALAQEAASLRLDPVAGSGVSGTATITAQGAAATVTVAVAGLAPGASHPVRLHAGTCAQPSASAGQLGVLTADASGRATLTTTRVTASAAGAPVDLTLALLADGPRSIAVGGPPPVACGEIQGLVAPTSPGLPRTGAGGAATPVSPLAGSGLLLAVVSLAGLAASCLALRRHTRRVG